MIRCDTLERRRRQPRQEAAVLERTVRLAERLHRLAQRKRENPIVVEEDGGRLRRAAQVSTSHAPISLQSVSSSCRFVPAQLQRDADELDDRLALDDDQRIGDGIRLGTISPFLDGDLVSDQRRRFDDLAAALEPDRELRSPARNDPCPRRPIQPMRINKIRSASRQL